MNKSFFIKISIILFVFIPSIAAILQSCGSKRSLDSFAIDNIQYDIKDGGIGYDVKDEKSYDTTKTRFVAVIHITNHSNNRVSFDSSNFKITDEKGNLIPISKDDNMPDLGGIAEEIEAEDATDYMIMSTVPKKDHYDLHVVSPISKSEKTIHF